MGSTLLPNVKVTRWMLDTRSLWPGINSISTDAAKDCLSALPRDERAAIERKHHVADAKMSLGSALLKRTYIATCLREARITSVDWQDITFKRAPDPKHGKPEWDTDRLLLAPQSLPVVEFNVSHQAGLVVLIGVCFIGNNHNYKPTRVGCDVVKIDERGELDQIRKSDLSEFTSTFGEVFSDGEIYDMTYTLPSHESRPPCGRFIPSAELGRRDRTITCGEAWILPASEPNNHTTELSSELIVQAKLKRFFTFFALKEAYIKLVGEGLLAAWLRNAEFVNVRAPKFVNETMKPLPHPGDFDLIGGGGDAFSAHDLAWRAKAAALLQTKSSNDADALVDPLELQLHNSEIVDTRMQCEAFVDGFMIASMIQPAETLLGCHGGHFPPWKLLDLDEDIVSIMPQAGK